MESLEKLNKFDYDINTYSDIDDYLKPTNTRIQKDLVDSLSNLSNLISNGLLFINYDIYENISKQRKSSDGNEYSVPKNCKVLSEVVSKGIKKEALRNYKNSLNENSNNHHKSITTNNNSIDIIVTEADRDDEFIEDEDIFDIDQSMIKPHHDLNFADSSMLFDQSAIFDVQDDNFGNQSMIFMDTNERNMFTREDPSNRGSVYLNINGLTELHPITNIENAEGNNSTLVNLADVDSNYLSTSDNESNNSTAYWTDDRIRGAVNDPEEYSTGEDEDHHMYEFNKVMKKFASLDSQDMKNLVYPRPNSRQKVMRNTYPSSSSIQVNQYQVFPDPYSEYDDINLAKATIMKQSFKNGFPHKKLYPVPENLNDEINYDSNANSSFTNYSPYHKGFVNIYSNNDSNDNINSSYSYIKDDLSITKDIVNKNVKKFNSMGLKNEEEVLYQKSHPLNFPFSNISFNSSSNESPGSTPTPEISSSNIASTTINRTNAPSSQSSVIYSTSPPNIENSIINSVNNFASLQSKFNQPPEDDDEVITSSQSNHVWTYKTKEQQPILSTQESNDSNDAMTDNQFLPQAINDPFSINEKSSFSDNESVIIPEKINIKDRISNIETCLLVNENNNNNSKNEKLNDQTNNKNDINENTSIHDINDDSINNIINITVIKEANNEDVLNESIGTVKDLATRIEGDIKKEENENHNSSLLSCNDGKTEASSEPVIPMEAEINENEKDCEKEENDEEKPFEFFSDHEEKENMDDGSDEEEPIEFLLDNEEHEHKLEYDSKQPLEVVENRDEDIEEQSISFKKDAEALINDNIIDGNLEDHIIIEEEDSIVDNAIEEALENKSFLIQENAFMDEACSNELSFSFGDHTAFHQAMKIFEDGSAPLEVIQEEDEGDNKEEENVINNVDNNANEEKIFKIIKNSINEQEMELINEKETDMESINKKESEVIDSDLQAIAKELEDMIQEPKAKRENNEMSKKKVKRITKAPLKLTKTATTNTINSKKVKATKKPVVKKPLNEKLTSTKKTTVQPKRVVKKISKSLDLSDKNLIHNTKVDNMIASNCVKAFTSSSLKQNIINTRPIEHEVAVSFNDFDKTINSKPKSKIIKRIRKVSKSDTKTENNSLPKLMSKSITKSTIPEKSISKPKPKINSKTIKKAINETSMVSSSNVKPLTRSKIINSKPTQTKSKSETNKKISTIKSKTKLTNRKGNYYYYNIYIIL